MEIFGFIRPNVDNTIEEECPIVNKVIIQNTFLKYLKENGIVIETKNKKSGKVTIFYKSLDELDNIIAKIKK